MSAKIGIVGMGVVGSAMKRLFADAVTYDVRENPPSEKELINSCDAVFVCVPTPMLPDGSCDVSIVEQCVQWIDAPLIVIRSTVAPGTTDRLARTYNKQVVFQPEYLGETTAHVFSDMGARQFVVLGGPRPATSAVADLYKHVYNSMVRFYFTDALTAELCKYMENAFYAVKVTFVNEWYDIARAFGADFNELRECWLADTRISRDHTFVYPDNRGFSGKCLPKDVNAIVASSRRVGYEPALLEAVLKINEKFRKLNKPKGRALLEELAAARQRAKPSAARDGASQKT